MGSVPALPPPCRVSWVWSGAGASSAGPRELGPVPLALLDGAEVARLRGG
jgi:hypothetical protein